MTPWSMSPRPYQYLLHQAISSATGPSAITNHITRHSPVPSMMISFSPARHSPFRSSAASPAMSPIPTLSPTATSGKATPSPSNGPISTAALSTFTTLSRMMAEAAHFHHLSVSNPMSSATALLASGQDTGPGTTPLSYHASRASAVYCTY